jgi:NodT family efflux transporter outer membrane factor (OMF) lipoprotein
MPSTPSRIRLLAAMLACSTASACMVGPNYHRPSVTTTPAFKEAQGWSPAQPSDAADKKDWWTVFGDPVLDGLEARVTVSNQTLKADEAAYREAHYLVDQDRAALFPTINGQASVTAVHSGSSAFVTNTTTTGTGTTGTGTTGTGTTGTGTTGTTVGAGSSGGRTTVTYEPTIGASWAPDLWGSVRRTINNAKANSQASAATLANARLSLQTELAIDYIELREYDAEKAVYDKEVAAYSESLRVFENQFRAGAQARSAVLTAQVQLQTAQASQTDLTRQRALMEHAIAVLVGVPPSELTITPTAWSMKLPQLPAIVPSALLQRRPDIAQAERSAAAANELIGVQIAAYYPNLNLTGDVGFDATSIGQIFNASSFLWSLGADATETIFDAGARRAKVRQARAAYDQAVATYRGTVLAAFQNVEDNLVAQRVYGDELTLLTSSAEAAALNQTLTANEYSAGTVDYTTVAAAQASALSAQLSQVQIEASRLATAVALIEALGGGWSASDLPKG